MRFTPHVTVAALVTKPNEHGEVTYLMVKEHAEGRTVYNQPAGHLETNENLLDAAIRETLEETGCQITLKHFLGVSHFVAPSNKETYIRFTFIGDLVRQDLTAKLDQGIIAAEWLTKAAIIEQTAMLRSPLILNDIERYERGEKLPLSSLFNLI